MPPLQVSDRTTRLDTKSLKPILKAYSIGYASWITPQVLRLINKAQQLRKCKTTAEYHEQLRLLRDDLLDTLRKSVQIHRFPAFCGLVVGGLTFIRPLIEKILERRNLTTVQRAQLSTFFATFFSSAAGYALLQQNCKKAKRPAGRTIDLTIFAAIRALDVLVGIIWQNRKEKRIAIGKYNRLDRFMGYTTDAAVFAISSCLVMRTWIYTPEKLPSGYRKWLFEIAAAPPRLVDILRNIYRGEFIYGKETSQYEILGPYCEEIGLPAELGDPVKTIPLPCIAVHKNFSQNCELYALYETFKGFKRAFPMYFTLNLLVRIRTPSFKHFLHACQSSIRSSFFLSTFIGLFWYTVCLTRTRIGPLLLKLCGKPYNPQLLEDWEVAFACAACGWSILIESAKRRAEIAFFVAPRAVAGLLPRKYDRMHLWREILIFALSNGVVVTAAKHNPKHVRGVLGRVMNSVLRT